MSLRLTIPAESEGRIRMEPGNGSLSYAGTIRILHLEDSELDAELIAARLQDGEVPVHVQRVENQVQYLEALDLKNFDIVLSDYNLPGFDGMVALQLARRFAPGIPFLFVTGALGEQRAVETLRSGATDYLLKDSLERLPAAVLRAMEEARARADRDRAEEETRLATDEALRANAAKNRFLSVLSHEVRNPLNALLGYAEYLKLDPLTEEQKHGVAQISRAGEQIRTLLEDVLDVSRIELGQISLDIRPVAAAEIVALVLKDSAPFAAYYQVRLQTSSPGDAEAFVMADKSRLTQVLSNLVSNAIKYNRPGGHVTVSCKEGSRSDLLSIAVQDTGIGIMRDKLERIGQPFDRLDVEHVTSAPGTGLGLAIVKNLVNVMSGCLTIRIEPGQGSVFSIELPRAAQVSTVHSGA